MTRSDFERAYKLRKRMIELQRLLEVGLVVSRKELRNMKNEYEKLKKQFDIVAEDLPCDIYLLLELRFFYGWPYYMIRKHWNWYGVDPHTTIEEYFAREKRSKRRKRKN